MEIILTAHKLQSTYLKIYSKEGGFFSKSIKYYAELYRRNKLYWKYDIDSKYIDQFISTYTGLFAIANRPWPKFNESEKSALNDFVNSGFLAKMVGQFLGGLMLKYNEEYNRISVESNRNQFKLQLNGYIGSYIFKADSCFKRVDPDHYNAGDCHVQLNKQQIELFLACVGYKFLLQLIPGYDNSVHSTKILSDSFYEILLSLPSEWLPGVARSVINQRFLP